MAEVEQRMDLSIESLDEQSLKDEDARRKFKRQGHVYIRHLPVETKRQLAMILDVVNFNKDYRDVAEQIGFPMEKIKWLPQIEAPASLRSPTLNMLHLCEHEHPDVTVQRLLEICDKLGLANASSKLLTSVKEIYEIAKRESQRPAIDGIDCIPLAVAAMRAGPLEQTESCHNSGCDCPHKKADVPCSVPSCSCRSSVIMHTRDHIQDDTVSSTVERGPPPLEPHPNYIHRPWSPAIHKPDDLSATRPQPLEPNVQPEPTPDPSLGVRYRARGPEAGVPFVQKNTPYNVSQAHYPYKPKSPMRGSPHHRSVVSPQGINLSVVPYPQTSKHAQQPESASMASMDVALNSQSIGPERISSMNGPINMSSIEKSLPAPVPEVLARRMHEEQVLCHSIHQSGNQPPTPKSGANPIMNVGATDDVLTALASPMSHQEPLSPVSMEYSDSYRRRQTVNTPEQNLSVGKVKEWLSKHEAPLDLSTKKRNECVVPHPEKCIEDESTVHRGCCPNRQSDSRHNNEPIVIEPINIGTHTGINDATPGGHSRSQMGPLSPHKQPHVFNGQEGARFTGHNNLTHIHPHRMDLQASYGTPQLIHTTSNTTSSGNNSNPNGLNSPSYSTNGESNPHHTYSTSNGNRSNRSSKSVRVFITYSYDNKNHVKEVLKMTKCLQNNGFKVSIDSEQSPEKSVQTMERYKKADYIVVVISPSYRTAVRSPEVMEKSTNAKLIFDYMRSEYENYGQKRRKYAVIMFPSASLPDIPDWMVNLARYEWARDWKNLCYFLNKPDQIVREHVHELTQNIQGYHI